MATRPQAIAIFDIDGVIRDVSGSYRRAIADTVEYLTKNQYRPSPADIDNLKSEGIWNNDWEATQEITYRYWETQGINRKNLNLDYAGLIDFFQSRYQGKNPNVWDGYICQENLLISASYLDALSESGIYWGFFSGAPRDEANYVLQKRLGLVNPILIAMEDAPGKPDPTGLFKAIEIMETQHDLPQNLPTIYAGDTVADIYTVSQAKSGFPQRSWWGIGILPPHILESQEYSNSYREKLNQAGADLVFNNLQELTPAKIESFLFT